MNDEMTPTLEGMLQLREIFQTMLQAGFSEKQASMILGSMLANGSTGGDEE